MGSENVHVHANNSNNAAAEGAAPVWEGALKGQQQPIYIYFVYVGCLLSWRQRASLFLAVGSTLVSRSISPDLARLRRASPRLPREPETRFLEKHEERAVEEQRFLRSKAEEKYRLTHDYNPIAGTYYDQSREHHFAQSREKLQALQGRAQQHRLPPSIRYGEGNDYNIINQQVRTNKILSSRYPTLLIVRQSELS